MSLCNIIKLENRMYKLILQSSRRSEPEPGPSGPERTDGCSLHEGLGAAASSVHHTEKRLLLLWTFAGAEGNDARGEKPPDS